MLCSEKKKIIVPTCCLINLRETSSPMQYFLCENHTIDLKRSRCACREERGGTISFEFLLQPADMPPAKPIIRLLILKQESDNKDIVRCASQSQK